MKTMLAHVGGTVAAGCLALPLAACAASVEINVATAYAADNFHTRNLLQYADEVNSWFPKNIVFIGIRIFGKLDAETKKRLLDAAGVAEQRGRRLSQSTNQDYENQLASNKVSVSTMDPFLRTYLDRIGESLAREWLKQAGSEELKILLKYTTDRSMK